MPADVSKMKECGRDIQGKRFYRDRDGRVYNQYGRETIESQREQNIKRSREQENARRRAQSASDQYSSSQYSSSQYSSSDLFSHVGNGVAAGFSAITGGFIALFFILGIIIFVLGVIVLGIMKVISFAGGIFHAIISALLMVGRAILYFLTAWPRVLTGLFGSLFGNVHSVSGFFRNLISVKSYWLYAAIIIISVLLCRRVWKQNARPKKSFMCGIMVVLIIMEVFWYRSRYITMTNVSLVSYLMPGIVNAVSLTLGLYLILFIVEKIRRIV